MKTKHFLVILEKLGYKGVIKKHNGHPRGGLIYIYNTEKTILYMTLNAYTISGKPTEYPPFKRLSDDDKELLLGFALAFSAVPGYKRKDNYSLLTHMMD